MDPSSLSRRHVLAFAASLGLSACGGGATDAPHADPPEKRTRLLPMPFARAGHQAVALPDGGVLLLGGSAGAGGALPHGTWRFDPANDRFEASVALLSGRDGAAVTLLADGRVLVVGGVRALTGAPQAELLDLADGRSVSTAAPPRRPRLYATATRLSNGLVLITGGTNPATEPTAELFDPATGRFELTAGRPAVHRSGHSATLLADGTVLLYGGVLPDGRQAAPERFVPATGRFERLPEIESTGRLAHAAVLDADGALWLIGGERADAAPVGNAIRWQPGSTLPPTALRLPLKRSGATATRLADGHIWIAGGGDAHGAPLAAGEWLRHGAPVIAGPSLAEARSLHTATRLGDGRVLVVGGLGRGLAVLATAEILA